MTVLDTDTGKQLIGNLNGLLNQIRLPLFRLRVRRASLSQKDLELLLALESQEEATLRTIQDILNYLTSLEPEKLSWLE